MNATGDEKNEFGLALRKQRKRKGYTQGDTARLLGVSARTISQWERGRQAPFGYSQKSVLDRITKADSNRRFDRGTRIRDTILAGDPIDWKKEASRLSEIRAWKRALLNSATEAPAGLEFKA